MNCNLSSNSNSLQLISSMISSIQLFNWLSSGGLRVKHPLAINAPPPPVSSFLNNMYAWDSWDKYTYFDLIWFDIVCVIFLEAKIKKLSQSTRFKHVAVVVTCNACNQRVVDQKSNLRPFPRNVVLTSPSPNQTLLVTLPLYSQT